MRRGIRCWVKARYLVAAIVLVFPFHLQAAGILKGPVSKLVCKIALTIRKPLFMDQSQLATKPVVEIKGTQEGPRGATVWVLEKTNPAQGWESSFQSHDGAVQGNPNWITTLLNKRAASFIGFRRLNETTLLIPGVDAVNSALLLINQVIREHKLGAEFPLSYFKEPKDRSRLLEYLSEFGYHLRLPISEGHLSMVHDISYHLAAIFYPHKILRHAQAQTRVLLEFTEKLRQEVSPEYRAQAEIFIEALLMKKMTEIDTGTGNAFLAFYSNLRDQKILRESILDVASKGREPVSMLIYFLQSYKRIHGMNVAFEAEVLGILKRMPVEYSPLSQSDMLDVCSEVTRNLNLFERAIRIIELENQ